MTDRHLPVFVYGTLRPGQGNYRRLLAEHALEDRPAQVRGYALYGAGIPYAVLERDSVIHGSVVWIDTAAYAATLLDLDHLEGYRPAQSHYVRVQRAATSLTSPPREAGPREASHQVFMYEAGPRFRRENFPRIDGGDWVAERARPRARTGRPA